MSVGGAAIPVTFSLPADVHAQAQEVALRDDRTLTNWIEALVERLVRAAEPIIMGGGPSYYDGGRKYR